MWPRIAISAILLCAGAQAQWLNYKEPGVPRLKDGKVNLGAPMPRTADGKPDLTGVWMHEITSVDEMKRLFGAAIAADLKNAPIGMDIGTQHKYGLNIMVDLKPGEVALTPAGEAFWKDSRAHEDFTNVCHGRYGWPVADLLSEPMKIVQAPKETMILYEIDGMHRQVFTDGRVFPLEYELPAYLGYSVGHWDGDTFVIETRGFNDRTPIDGMGHPRSEEMHVIERLRRRDFGHLDVEITFDDPKFYTRSFTVKIPHNLVPDNDIFEMICSENEKDRQHIVNAQH